MSIEGSGGIHVIVTGASSGIGEVIARTLAAGGCRLTLAARRADKLEALARDINPSGKRVIAVPTDVTVPADLERLVARAKAIHGRVDALVNNAGWRSSKFKWWEMTQVESALAVQTNLAAVVELTRLVLPDMLEHRSGSIVNIGSVQGRIAMSSLYSASKFGVRGFSLSLRRELRGTGVNVSLVSPGFIRTDDSKSSRGLPRPSPAVVAQAVQRVLDHPRAEVIVPSWYGVFVALEPFFPGLADYFVSKINATKYAESG
jgi:short-subunit dehydrogenase